MIKMDHTPFPFHVCSYCAGQHDTDKCLLKIYNEFTALKELGMPLSDMIFIQEAESHEA